MKFVGLDRTRELSPEDQARLGEIQVEIDATIARIQEAHRKMWSPEIQEAAEAHEAAEPVAPAPGPSVSDHNTHTEPEAPVT